MQEKYNEKVNLGNNSKIQEKITGRRTISQQHKDITEIKEKNGYGQNMWLKEQTKDESYSGQRNTTPAMGKWASEVYRQKMAALITAL